LKSDFADAVNLLRATGRTVSEEDEKYLRLLLTHHCGWSATYPEHITTNGAEVLRTAGETLEDVYNGMKDWRWAESSEDPWGFAKEEKCVSLDEAFPHYYRKDNGNFGIHGWDPKTRLVEYPGKVQT
jgi:hypothetical protein